MPTRVTAFQATTAIPHIRQRKKRNANGEPLYEHTHARWFFSCNVENKAKIDPLMSECVNHKKEPCSFTQIESFKGILGEEAFTWPIVPKMYSRGEITASSACELGLDGSYTCFEWESANSSNPLSEFRPFFGNWRFALYARATEINLEDEKVRAREICKKAQGKIPPDGRVGNYSLNPEILSDYLRFITRGVDDDDDEIIKLSSPRDRWFQQNTPGIFSIGHPSLPIEFSKTVFTIALASSVYDHLKNATIPLETCLSQPFFQSEWVPRPICDQLDLDKHHTNPTDPKVPPCLTMPLTRQQAFSCVARFDSGHVELDPDDLDSVLALCSEDSMYVAAMVLADPFEESEPHELRRIVGNIGHPGISLLVAPEEPRMRPPSNKHTAISHGPYDFQRENNFGETSLHLSFTDWRFPLEAGGNRTIDQGVVVVEAVISVLDGGKWVADLDLLCIDFQVLSRITQECDQHEDEAHDLEFDYTSIDNWDELLDAPEGVGIFRAHGNWAAR